MHNNILFMKQQLRRALETELEAARERYIGKKFTAIGLSCSYVWEVVDVNVDLSTFDSIAVVIIAREAKKSGPGGKGRRVKFYPERSQSCIWEQLDGAI